MKNIFALILTFFFLIANSFSQTFSWWRIAANCLGKTETELSRSEYKKFMRVHYPQHGEAYANAKTALAFAGCECEAKTTKPQPQPQPQQTADTVTTFTTPANTAHTVKADTIADLKTITPDTFAVGIGEIAKTGLTAPVWSFAKQVKLYRKVGLSPKEARCRVRQASAKFGGAVDMKTGHFVPSMTPYKDGDCTTTTTTNANHKTAAKKVVSKNKKSRHVKAGGQSKKIKFSLRKGLRKGVEKLNLGCLLKWLKG